MMAQTYDPLGTARKRVTNDPAALRTGHSAATVWWVTAPSRATASSPWTIRSVVQKGMRSPGFASPATAANVAVRLILAAADRLGNAPETRPPRQLAATLSKVGQLRRSIGVSYSW